MLAVRFGMHDMHEEARPLTLSLGLGPAGEGAITLLRANRRGVRMPWTDFSLCHAEDPGGPRFAESAIQLLSYELGTR